VAQRPTWKGSLKLSLITIPIRVFPATDASADVSFRQLHRKCKTPIQLKKWCPHCEEEVTPDEIVKGYESAKGQFVVVEEEEIKRTRPSTTHVIDLTHRFEESDIDPIYVERVYYLTPDAKAAGAVFAVFREALEGRWAIGHLALHGRESLVAVAPKDKGLVMYTLRTAGEVRAMSALDELDLADVKVKSAEMNLARQVLDSLEPVKSLSTFTDHYQEALREMLEAKGARATVPTGARAASTTNLMEALRQSLAHIGSGKRQPAKEAGRKPARVIAHPSSRKAKRAS
jgi:DNA end-binding protein Ku